MRAGVASLWVAVLGRAGGPLASPLGVQPAAIPEAARWRGLLDDLQESQDATSRFTSQLKSDPHTRQLGVVRQSFQEKRDITDECGLLYNKIVSLNRGVKAVLRDYAGIMLPIDASLDGVQSRDRKFLCGCDPFGSDLLNEELIRQCTREYMIG